MFTSTFTSLLYVLKNIVTFVFKIINCKIYSSLLKKNRSMLLFIYFYILLCLRTYRYFTVIGRCTFLRHLSHALSTATWPRLLLTASHSPCISRDDATTFNVDVFCLVFNELLSVNCHSKIRARIWQVACNRQN